MSKRRTKSGIDGLELQMAYESLKSLQRTIASEELGLGDGVGKPEFADAVAGLLKMMRDRLDSPQDFSFSDLTIDHLRKLNISEAGLLELKSDSMLAEQVERTKIVGQDDISSSVNLYRHLERLKMLVGRPQNEAAARAWTDAFFFRVSAMAPQKKMSVLSMKQRVPPTAMKPSSTTPHHGVEDYTAEAADRSMDERFLSNPTIERAKSVVPSDLMVTVANSFSMSLRDHIPQAVCKMYACSKALAKPIVRGVLTVGDTWIFLLLALNSHGDGAQYWQSEEISILTLTPPGRAHITPPWPDVIAGILADWMKHSFEDIESGDDWFEVGL